MIRYLRAFGRFWFDFVVGDDWRVLATVVVGIALLVLLVHNGVDAWWLLPLLVTALLGAVLLRAES
jgi:hypothetical protein